MAWCSNTAATDESTPPDKPKYYFIITQFFFQGSNGGFYERIGGPVLCAAANINQKVLQQLLAINTMGYLGVKLDTVSLRAFYLVSRNFYSIGTGNDLKIIGNAGNGIAHATSIPASLREYL